MKAITKNSLRTLSFTVILGAFAGAVIWCFLKAVNYCTVLIWEKIPEITGSRLVLLALCPLGALVAGILRKAFGDYPEELSVVMDRIKKEKHYTYHPMLAILLCAFIPLVFGSSVGPEAGLTGIIAALCYWVGDNVSYAKQNSTVFTEIGEAVTLGQLFRSPLFGILAVEEGNSEEENDLVPKPLQRTEKLVYYGLSTASSFLVIGCLNSVFGKAMSGFPSFDSVTIEPYDYALLLVYIPIGLALYFFFEKCEHISKGIAGKIPAIIKEVLCGIIIAVMGIAVPTVLFSGEEQMAELMEKPDSYVPLFLIGICFLKIIMTVFCINFGMKGGHFFPVIFACTCMGYGLAGLIFADPASHVVFAAGIVTATMLGAQLKKPLSVAILLLLCFPFRFLFWLFLGAAIGAGLANKFKNSKS